MVPKLVFLATLENMQLYSEVLLVTHVQKVQAPQNMHQLNASLVFQGVMLVLGVYQDAVPALLGDMCHQQVLHHAYLVLLDLSLQNLVPHNAPNVF
jgi:hypothetical protein